MYNETTVFDFKTLYFDERFTGRYVGGYPNPPSNFPDTDSRVVYSTTGAKAYEKLMETFFVSCFIFYLFFSFAFGTNSIRSRVF